MVPAMTRVLVLSCSLLSIAASVEAQTATGTLSGVIRDTTGAVMPGVSVTARNAATGVSRIVTSDSEGRYRIVNLEPGEYEVRAELAGFRTAAMTGVTVLVGGTTELDLAMSVGQLAEEVTVATEPQLIEPSKTDLSRVVSSREIESLPISGRNFVDFVKLSSGVALGRENVGGGAFKEPDVGVGSAAAPRLSFGGQPELNTQIQVDGADNVQTFTGLPRATPSQEAAREFRVLNSTYLAEYGRALGGFVNIVTKSGTNRGSGSAYYFGMSDVFAARSILNRPGEDELGQHQFGGTFGGPITPGSDVFLRQLRGADPGAVEPLLAGRSGQPRAVELCARAARASSGDDRPGPRQYVQRVSGEGRPSSEREPHPVGPLQLPRLGHGELPGRRRTRVADVEHRARQRDARPGARRQRRIGAVADACQRGPVPVRPPHL